MSPQPSDNAEQDHARQARRIQQLERIVREQHNTLKLYYRRLQEVTYQRDTLEHSRFGRARRLYLRWKNRLLCILGKPPVDERHPFAASQAMLPDPLETLDDSLQASAVMTEHGTVYPPTTAQCDIIYFSVIEWSHLVQRPQQLMTRMAQRGHRVFWVDVRLGLLPDAADFSIPLPLCAPGIYAVNLPGQGDLIYRREVDDDLMAQFIQAFEKIRHAYFMDNAVCMVSFPGWAPLAIALRAKYGWKVVYDCLDDQDAFRKIHGFTTRNHEPWLIRDADLVITTADILVDRFQSVSRIQVKIPNGADYEHFASAQPTSDLDNLPRPLIGYIGTIAEWFDHAALTHAANTHPDWSFVLVGNHAGAEWGKHPNIHYVDPLPDFRDVARYVKAFDVCVMPFRDLPITRAANPVKLYEYLAAGKPIVARALPETLPMRDRGLLSVYDTPGSFVSALERALGTPESPAMVAAQQAYARENSWDARCNTLQQTIGQIHGRVTIVIVTFDNLNATRACLESLLARTQWPNLRIVCVDNGSGPDLRAYLHEMADQHPMIQIIENGRNLGYTKANNIGLKMYQEDSDYFVLLNDDTIVTTGWLPRLIHHLDWPRVGLVGPVTNWAGNEARIEVGYASLSEMNNWAIAYMQTHDGQCVPIRTLNGYCLAIKRETLTRVGLLDEAFEIGMFEDDDYSLRARQAGLEVICCQDVFIHHTGRSSFAKLSDADYRAIFERNQAIFQAKHKDG